MAELTIRLQVDPNTGKKNITISLSSDADALPHEHEQQHRALVEKLIEKGLLAAEELGQITVERIEEEKLPATPTAAPKETERRKQGQGH